MVRRTLSEFLRASMASLGEGESISLPIKIPNMFIERFEQTHPIWDARHRLWEDLDAVTSARLPRSRVCKQGKRESERDYEVRLQLAKTRSEIAPTIHNLASSALEKSPSRPKSIVEDFEDFIRNCNRRGKSLTKFMRDRAIEKASMGASVIVVDRPAVINTGRESVSIEQTSVNFESIEVARKVDENEIFLVPYKIYQVRDWETDPTGHFQWIRICEEVRRLASPEEEEEVVTRFKEWDRTSWRIIEVRKTRAGRNRSEKKSAYLVGMGNHNLGMVPVVIDSLSEDSNDPMDVYSPAYQAIQDDLSAMKNDSDLQYDSWLHAHPNIKDYRRDTDRPISLGGYSPIQLDPDSKEDVQYLQLPESQLKVLRDNVKQNQSGARRLLGVDEVSSSDAPSALGASGRSRAVAFSVQQKPHLIRIAETTENSERQIFEIGNRFRLPQNEIRSPYETTIENSDEIMYSKDFSVAGAQELTEVWADTRTSINSETYDKEMQKRIVTAALGDTSRDVLEAIFTEIEENPRIGIREPGAADTLEEPDEAVEDPNSVIQAFEDLRDMSPGDLSRSEAG